MKGLHDANQLDLRVTGERWQRLCEKLGTGRGIGVMVVGARSSPDVDLQIGGGMIGRMDRSGCGGHQQCRR